MVWRNPSTGEIYYPASYVEQLRAALKELLDDEWRCTVDWGPRDERQAILDRCSALVGHAHETSEERK